MTFPTFEDLFTPLVDQHCWCVRQGYDTFLTMEFGAPRKEVHDVLRASETRRFPSRLVTVHGEWHLWIYYCAWTISYGDEVLASSDSTRDVIAKACGWLDGQALTGFVAEVNAGRTRFSFDLGATLHTRPDETGVEEQWKLFCPDGNVFRYCGNGTVNYKPASGKGSGDETWLPAR